MATAAQIGKDFESCFNLHKSPTYLLFKTLDKQNLLTSSRQMLPLKLTDSSIMIYVGVKIFVIF